MKRWLQDMAWENNPSSNAEEMELVANFSHWYNHCSPNLAYSSLSCQESCSNVLAWNICRLRLNSVQKQYALLTAEPALHAKYNLTPNRSMRNILQARNTHWNYKEQSSENNKNTQHKKLTHVAHRLGKAPCHTRALQLSTTNAQLPLSVGNGVRPQCKHSGQAWNTRATLGMSRNERLGAPPEQGAERRNLHPTLPLQ